MGGSFLSYLSSISAAAFYFSLDMVRKPSFDDQFDQVLAELSQALEQHNNSQDRGLKTKIKFFYQQIAQYKDGKISRDTLIENITFMSQPIQNQAVKVVIDSFTKN
ncbi:MAG: hypothetical protein HWD59_14515 [Coxiellaceae bacterium]|nr:MAG: hypothetical protein HWD59_14515 [Coxiellaceae bacterium]